jgi:spermidine synthase
MSYLIGTAVFLSGFASLGYELCWIRKGALLIGATPHALSIVVAVFFAGLAAGAYLFGLLSQRTKHSLLLYGILECAIGILAACTPDFFSRAQDAYVLAYQWTGSGQSLQILIRSALVAALIFLPTLLMGGTLPLLCRFSIHDRQADIRSAAGILYALNTAGAFAGCMLCGLYLIPFWGIDRAIWCNSLLSVAAGIVVMVFSRKLPLPAPTVAAGSPARTGAGSVLRRPPKWQGAIAYGIFFGTGLTALGYEILWARFLSLIIHNTVYTCLFSLGAVLLGITVGGLLVCLLNDAPEQDLPTFAAAHIFIGFSVLLIVLQPVGAWNWLGETRSAPAQASLCLLILLVPSIASGMSFPLAYRLVATSAVNSGRDFGYLSAASTLGGIVGSLLVGFYLLPAQGMYATLMFLTFVSLAIGSYAILAPEAASSSLRRRWLTCGIAALWVAVALYGRTSRLPAAFLAGNDTMIEFAEGMSSFIGVVKRDGIKTLEIDRMWQGQNRKSYQILAAHIPMILHQEPKSVLVIGMGTGQTASRFLKYPIERLDCVDIEATLPGMLRRHFDADWLMDPRTRIITDDGRNFTSHAAGSYDIISVEVGQSFRPQIASFYTVEFYRQVKRRLTAQGLACQFVPVGFFREEEFRSVVGSFLEVFPQSTLWFNKHAEFILVGNATQQPLLSPKRLGLLQGDPGLRADLDFSYDGSPWLAMNQKEVFAANFLMGPQTLAKLSAAAPRYHDDRPVLEYQAARNRYQPERLHALIEKNLDHPERILTEKIRITSELKMLQIREQNVHNSLAGK